MRTASILLSLALVVGACGGSNTVDETTTSATETTSPEEFVPDTLPEHLLANWNTPETGLSLKFPVDWLPHEEVENAYVSFTTQPVEGDSFLENFSIVLSDVPGEFDLDDILRQDSILLGRTYDDLEIIGSYEDTIDGAPASAVAFNTTSVGQDGVTQGVPVSVLRILALKDSRLIQFTFIASRHEFDNFNLVIQQVIDSIRLDT